MSAGGILDETYRVAWIDLCYLRDNIIETLLTSLVGPLLYLLAFGFGIGALAPWILGIIGDTIGLSAGIASLAAVWVVGSIALLVARVFFYDKDATRLKPRSV